MSEEIHDGGGDEGLFRGVTARDVAILGLRIFALYLWATEAWVFPEVVRDLYCYAWGIFPAEGTEWVWEVTVFVQFFLFGIIGIAFWWLAPRWAKWLLPERRSEGAAPLSGGGEYIQAIGFSLVGAWLTAWAIPPFLVSLVRTAKYQGTPWGPDLERIIANLAGLMVAIGLFLGARGLSRYWHRLTGREARGTAHDDSAGEREDGD
jgi:hypothetical protein